MTMGPHQAYVHTLAIGSARRIVHSWGTATNQRHHTVPDGIGDCALRLQWESLHRAIAMIERHLILRCLKANISAGNVVGDEDI